MKKISLFLILMVIIIIILSSCKKSDDMVSAGEALEKVTISINLSKETLKSGLIISENLGDTSLVADTTNFYYINNCQVIFSSKNYDNKKVDGVWEISLVDSDNNFPLVENFHLKQRSFSVSLKPRELGLYKIKFTSLRGTVVLKYLRHFGLPGELGDDQEHDYAFRVQKNLFQGSKKQFEGFTSYVRVYPGEFDEMAKTNNLNVNDLSNYFAILSYAKDTIINNAPFAAWWAKSFKLKKAKYADREYREYSDVSYYYFSFSEEDYPPLVQGQYRINCRFGSFGCSDCPYISFRSITKSDWSRDWTSGDYAFQFISY